MKIQPRVAFSFCLVLGGVLSACAPQVAPRPEDVSDDEDPGSGSGSGGRGGRAGATGRGGSGGGGGLAVDASLGRPAISDVGAGARDSGTADGGREAGVGRDAPPSGASVEMGGAPLAPGKWKGEPVIVAVGFDGRRMISQDAKAWSSTQDTMARVENEKALRALAYGNGTVIAVGGSCAADDCTKSRVMTFDGKDWVDQVVPSGTGRLDGVAYGNGVWVAAGKRGVVRSEDNGKTWVKVGPATLIRLRSVAFGKVGGNEMFVAVGDGYMRATSRDGQSWEIAVASNMAEEGLRSVVIAKGTALAVGGVTSNGVRSRSDDGKRWEDTQMGVNLQNALVYENKFYVFTSTNTNNVLISSDARVWMTQSGQLMGTSILLPERIEVVNIGGKPTLIGRKSATSSSPLEIRTSTDGINWTTQFTGGNSAMESGINAFLFAGP
jgi:hypothetical protein